MTSSTPDHESGTPPPTEEPQGLVEEIRHEIEEAVEEVVEHVPPPVRWTVRKLVLLVTASVVGLIVVAVVSVGLYFARRTELVAQELTLILNQTLAARSNLRVEVADVRGNPFRRVRLIRPRVVFRDGGAPILEAPAIELSYSLWSLARGGRELDIVVEKPVLRLERQPNGHLRLPTWKTSGKIGKPRDVDVRLRVHDGTVALPFGEPDVHGLELDAMAGTGAQSHATIRILRWRDGPYATRNLELRGAISAGDSVRFEVNQLVTPDLALSATGSWKKGEQDRAIHIDLRRVRWTWLAQVTKNGAFDVPGEARAVIDAQRSSTWSGRFQSRLAWNGLPMEGDGGFVWDGNTLRVEPLLARSTAGSLNGRARWSKPGWQVGGAVRDGHPDAWKAIGIPGWPEGRLAGEFTYTVDTRRHVSDGVLVARLGDSELDRWHADSAYVTALLPARSTRTFDVRALRRGGVFTLHGATVEGGWRGDYTVKDLPLDEWPDGRASGIRGTLTSGAGAIDATGGGLAVTGELQGERTTWLGMEAGAWRLAAVDGALLPKPDLTAGARLGNVMFMGVHFDSVASPIHLGDQTLSMGDTRANAGDTLVTLAGNADWNGSTWNVMLDRAKIASPHFAWTADPPVRITGNPQGVTFDRVIAHDGPAEVAFSGRWAVPDGSYDWSMRIRSLDLARLGLPDAWGLGGRLDAELDVNGIYGAPRWKFDGRASRPAWNGHTGDSLAIAASGAARTVVVDRSEFRLGTGRLEGRGRFDGMSTAWPESLVGTAITRWLVSSDHWSGTVAADKLPIEPATALAPAAAGWEGDLSGELAFEGSPKHPRLRVDAAVTPLAWRDFEVDRLGLKGRYADDLLEVEELKATRDRSVSIAHGSIPVRLSADANPKLLDHTLTGDVRIENGDLGILTLLVPQIAQASGRMDGHATIRGTGVNPTIDGGARLTDGTVRLAGREELLRNVTATLRVNRTTLTLDSLSASEGERGRVDAHGTVQLQDLKPSGYRFDVRMRQFAASDPGLYAVVFDGDFVVTDGPRLRGQWLPLVTGRATVDHAVILIDFANQSESEQLAASNPPLYWLYRVDLTAKSNVHWQPPDGDIEFSVDLTAEQTPTELRLFGEMQSLRGTYYFLSNRFDVRRAILTFDNAEGVNPLIDAEATTKLVAEAPSTPGAITQSTSTDDYTITVTLSGRVREPAIVLASSPTQDENWILQQLTYGRFVSRGVTATDPFDHYLTRALNRTLSAEMSRAFKGYISEWVLDREQGGLFGGQGELIATVGSQVTPNLLLRYRQRLPGFARETARTPNATGPFERDIEAEYRLNRFFLIQSELTQRRTLGGNASSTPTTPDFNVNLKARWEY